MSTPHFAASGAPTSRDPERVAPQGNGPGHSSSFAEDVEYYLSLTPRQLPSKYLYDELGSALFEAICHLSWYQIARTEQHLLNLHAREILTRVGPLATLIELGPGSGKKLASLVEAAGLDRPLTVHLVDVSPLALEAAAGALESGRAAPDLTVVAHRATYEDGLSEIQRDDRADGRTMVLFLGSNIGNFDRPGADAFLRSVRAALAAGDCLLLGTDLVRDERDLLLAYDDPLGVTAAFNRNLLVRANRDLGADFDLAGFDHRAVWNTAASRIEMHLVSTRSQRVRVPASHLDITFASGEAIWTESSYKYRRDEVVQMLERNGFGAAGQWTEDHFSADARPGDIRSEGRISMDQTAGIAAVTGVPGPEVKVRPGRAEQMFPVLTPAQIARVATHGRTRQVVAGEALFTVGQATVSFFVITKGQLQVVRPSGATETLVVVHGPGEFTGEVNMLSGRRSLVLGAGRRGQARSSSSTARTCLSLVQTDSELSEIIMRAFILRRVELIANGLGDVVLIGSVHCSGNAPHQGVPDAQRPSVHVHRPRSRRRRAGRCSISFNVNAADVPVLICRGEVVLRNPTNREIADCLGFNDAIDETKRARPGHRRRRTGGARRRGVRRVGRPRCAGHRDERARRTGGLELEDRKLSRVSDRHLGPGTGRRARTRRRRNSAPRS